MILCACICIWVYNITTLFFGSGTKLFIAFWVKGFSTWGEKYNFFLSWLFHLTPQRAAPRRKLLVWPRCAPENLLLSSSVESQLSGVFFSNCKILSQSLQGMTSFTPRSYFLSVFFIVTSVIVTPVNTCTQCVHLTNPCAKPKGSQPN